MGYGSPEGYGISQYRLISQAELAANSDRIQTLINAGQNLIDASKCQGGEDAVSARLRALNEQVR